MSGTTKHKYVAFGFIYLFALICAYFLSSLLCFMVFILSGIVFFLCLNKSTNIKLYCTFIGVAFLVSGLHKTVIAERSESLIGKEGIVKGIVKDVKIPDNDTVMIEISGSCNDIPVKIAVFTTDTGLSHGNRIEIPVSFSELKNSAVFNEQFYYYSKGIFLRGYATGDIALAEKGFSLRGIIADINKAFKTRIENVFPDERGGLIKAVLFGDKSGLSPLLSESIRRSGIAHLTAVSGMHLSLMIHIAVCFINLFFRKRNVFVPVISALFSLILMLFFGMTASVMRSGIMMIIFYGSTLLKRKSVTFNSLSTALLIILLFDPTACMDTGLWLSVLGTLGVGVASPLVIRKLRIPRKKKVLRTLIPSLCAFMLTMPVGAFCFGGMSIVSAVTGLLVQPLFTVILITVPLGLLFPFLSILLFFVGGVSAYIFNCITLAFGGLSFSYFEADKGSTAVFLVLMIFVTALSCVPKIKLRRIVSVFIAGFTAFITALSLTEYIQLGNTIIKVYSDGENGLIKVKTMKGTAIYAVSDNIKTSDMTEKYALGEKLCFICIASGDGNNRYIKEERYDCAVHLPDNGNMTYDIGGEYFVDIIDGEIILGIDGVTIGLLNIENNIDCDIEILGGYRKNYTADGNYATILCDKKFYNCGDSVNAYYSNTEIIIKKDGKFAVISE